MATRTRHNIKIMYITYLFACLIVMIIIIIIIILYYLYRALSFENTPL
jgi:hypothetical protein